MYLLFRRLLTAESSLQVTGATLHFFTMATYIAAELQGVIGLQLLQQQAGQQQHKSSDQ